MTRPPRVAAFVQARMTSKRLPGKVLETIAGRPMLDHVVERVSRAQTVDVTWVLTSTNPADDPIADWGASRRVPIHRGPLDDVLSRYHQAALLLNPSYVVRITADCPLMDPHVIDLVVGALLADSQLSYASSRMPDDRTYPIGLDVEAFTTTALQWAAAEAREAYQREHVTPWFYDGSFGARILHVRTEPSAGYERWTVDTREDLEFVRALVDVLPRGETRWREVQKVLDAHPEIRAINAAVPHKNYRESSTETR